MDAVVPLLKRSLPGARPPASDAHEAVALVVRAVCVARGLSPTTSGDADPAVPPEGWTDGGDVLELAFTKGPTLKLLKMGPILLVHGVQSGAPEVESLELTVTDFVNEGAPLNDANRAFGLGLVDLVTMVDSFLDGLGAPRRGSAGGKPSGAAAAPPRSTTDPLRADPLRADPLRADPLRADPLRADPQGEFGRPWNPAGDIGRGDLDPFHRGGGMVLDPFHGPPLVMPPAGRGRVPGARFDPIFPGGPLGPLPPGAGYRAGPDPDHLPMPGQPYMPPGDDDFGNMFG